MAERDENGRFKKGNRVSPGRKPRQVEETYLEVTLGEVTLDKWRAVVRAALAQAIEGDARARTWLGEYVLGKPPQILELQAADALALKAALEAMAPLGVTPGKLFEALIQQAAVMTEAAEIEAGEAEND